MLWPKLVMSGVWSILCQFHCGRKMNHLDCTTKASDDAAIETFVKIAFPNCFKQSIRAAPRPAVQWPVHGTVMKNEGGKH